MAYGFHRVHVFSFSCFFVFFKESFLWDPSVTHENCLAAFGPTVYGQNQVKKRLYHHSVSHMIMGREQKDKLGMSFSFCKKKGISLIYILWGNIKKIKINFMD